MAKKVAGLGIWCKLKSLHDSSCLWVGSAHLTQGSPMEKHATEVHEFVCCMPPVGEVTAVGIDANTPLKWVRKQDDLEAVGIEGKGEYMVGKFLEGRMEFTPPPRNQQSMPTCRPRNQEAVGRHIDLLGTRDVRVEGKGIVVDSHRFVGSDHDGQTEQTKHVKWMFRRSSSSKCWETWRKDLHGRTKGCPTKTRNM